MNESAAQPGSAPASLLERLLAAIERYGQGSPSLPIEFERILAGVPGSPAALVERIYLEAPERVGAWGERDQAYQDGWNDCLGTILAIIRAETAAASPVAPNPRPPTADPSSLNEALIGDIQKGANRKGARA